MPSRTQIAYERLLPMLLLADCEPLLKAPIKNDPALTKILRSIEKSPAYLKLKEYYELETPEYWENLELIGECDDLVTLGNYKKALCKLWKDSHATKERNKTNSKKHS